MFFLTYFFFFFLTYYFSLFFHNLSNFFENSITRITIFVVRTVCIDVFIIYYHASMRFGHSSHAAAKGHTSAAATATAAAAACTIWVACHGTGDWHAFAENAILCFAPTTVTLKMLIIRKMWSFFFVCHLNQNRTEIVCKIVNKFMGWNVIHQHQITTKQKQQANCL